MKTQTRKRTASRPARLGPAVEKNGPLQIDVLCIEEHPLNPRQEFEEAELRSLAASMDSMTLMQPVQLTRAPGASEKFQLISGERRWRAAKLAGWKTIAAYVVKADPRVIVEMMVDENLQHKELSPIEKARSVELLTRPVAKGGAGLTNARAAEKFGKTESWASNLLRVLKLPADWQARIERGEVTLREARAIATFADRPDVLAAVDADRQSNAEDWHTSDDFERQLKFIADRLDGLVAAEFPAAGGQAAPPATIRLDRRCLAATPQAATPPPDAAEGILALVGQLTSLADLERVQRAVAARVSELQTANDSPGKHPPKTTHRPGRKPR